MAPSKDTGEVVAPFLDVKQLVDGEFVLALPNASSSSEQASK